MLNRIEWERSEFATLRTQMEELFDSFFGDLTSRYFIPAVGSFADGQVFENDREFVLVIELPDLKTEDIEVTVRGNCLTLKTQQAENYTTASEGPSHRKTRKKTRTRNVQLPNDLQTDRIEASFADGLLKITLPKRERTLQRVKVKT
jgi:HSP20 family protein